MLDSFRLGTSLIAIAALLGAACSDDANPTYPPADGGGSDAADSGALCDESVRLAGKCPTLDGYRIFKDTGGGQVPEDGVFSYDVIAPLFADEAVKHRFVQLPSGTKAEYSEQDPWALPVGAVVVKTFAYPRDARDPSQGERLIETRLLIRGATEIVPITYVWNEAQNKAVREVAGRDVQVAWIDETGTARSTEYRIPSTNDCKRCHGENDVHLLGVRTRQLDRATIGGENQIDALAARGFFATPPPPGTREHLVDPRDTTASADARGRSYLDANCGHCHNKSSAADWSGLELDWGDRAPGLLGVCKSPSSAGDTGGHRFDVLPGKPEASVMLYRMQITNSAYRMPEGSRTPDAVGLDVIADWIRALPADDCKTSVR